jgi:hypothetical protein
MGAAYSEQELDDPTTAADGEKPYADKTYAELMGESLGEKHADKLLKWFEENYPRIVEDIRTEVRTTTPGLISTVGDEFEKRVSAKLMNEAATVFVKSHSGEARMFLEKFRSDTIDELEKKIVSRLNTSLGDTIFRIGDNATTKIAIALFSAMLMTGVFGVMVSRQHTKRKTPRKPRKMRSRSTRKRRLKRQ